MSIEKTKSLLLASAVGLALAGCGSGSSGGSATPVAGPADPGPATPPPASQKVTLSGKVTDMPIPNATVIVTVDGRSFQAPLPTTADGSYEVEIESDDPDALVTCEAFDPNGVARFSAVVDSFAAIDAAADSDDVVADIDITNVTTAKHVLAERLSTDGSIDSIDEMIDAASRIDTNALLELSAAIKLVVENIDGTVLPSDIADTTELAEAIVDGTTSFLDDVEAVTPGALDSAIDLVLTDGNATRPFTQDSVPGVYVSQDNFSLFAMFEIGYGFNASFERDEVSQFDWVVNDDGTLNLWFDGPEQAVERVTLVDRNGDVVNVVVRDTVNDGAGHHATAWFMPFDSGFTAADVPGSYSTMDEPGRLTVFFDDGSGHDLDLLSGVVDGEFEWNVDEAGVLSLTEIATGETGYARRLAGSDGDILRLLVWDRDATGRLDHANVIDVRRTDAVVGSTGGSEANMLLLAGNTYAVTEGGETALFRFRADGTFTEIGQFEGDTAWDVFERTGDWSIDANGIVTTMFPGDAAPEQAAIVQGLGDDFMVVETGDIDRPVQQVTRVVSIEAELAVGSFLIVDADGTSSESVTLNADFTGVHVDEAGIAEAFEWGLSADGRLVVEVPGDATFDHETMTFHMLAGSGGDLLRFVVVRRMNGALAVDAHDAAGQPETLMVVELLRTL